MILMRDVKGRINEAVFEAVKGYGFFYKKSAGEFVRSENGYDHIFKPVYTKWNSYISLEIFVYIVHIRTEKLLTQILKEKETGITLGSGVNESANALKGNFTRTLYVTIDSEKDVDSIIDLLKRLFFEVAVPFFNEYSNLKKIDLLFNEHPLDSMPLFVHSSGGDRCVKGLIIAKLVNRRNYEELVVAYDAYIAENRQFVYSYNEVKKYLANHIVDS